MRKNSRREPAWVDDAIIPLILERVEILRRQEAIEEELKRADIKLAVVAALARIGSRI